MVPASNRSFETKLHGSAAASSVKGATVVQGTSMMPYLRENSVGSNKKSGFFRENLTILLLDKCSTWQSPRRPVGGSRALWRGSPSELLGPNLYFPSAPSKSTPLQQAAGQTRQIFPLPHFTSGRPRLERQYVPRGHQSERATLSGAVEYQRGGRERPKSRERTCVC